MARLTDPETSHQAAQDALLAYLAINGPAKLDRLSLVLGLPRRECERAVENLRRMGNAIGSGDEGIYLCHTREEGLAAYRRLRSRYITQAVTARAVRRAALRLPSEQAELTLWR